jgi:hypothetical protein
MDLSAYTIKPGLETRRFGLLVFELLVELQLRLINIDYDF